MNLEDVKIPTLVKYIIVGIVLFALGCLFFFAIFHNDICFAIPESELKDSFWITNTEDDSGSETKYILQVDNTGTIVTTFAPFGQVVFVKQWNKWRHCAGRLVTGEYVYAIGYDTDFSIEKDTLTIKKTNQRTSEIEFCAVFTRYEPTEEDWADFLVSEGEINILEKTDDLRTIG